jgi:hypothetical protein
MAKAAWQHKKLLENIGMSPFRNASNPRQRFKSMFGAFSPPRATEKDSDDGVSVLYTSTDVPVLYHTVAVYHCISSRSDYRDSELHRRVQFRSEGRREYVQYHDIIFSWCVSTDVYCVLCIVWYRYRAAPHGAVLSEV